MEGIAREEGCIEAGEIDLVDDVQDWEDGWIMDDGSELGEEGDGDGLKAV